MKRTSHRSTIRRLGKLAQRLLEKINQTDAWRREAERLQQQLLMERLDSPVLRSAADRRALVEDSMLPPPETADAAKYVRPIPRKHDDAWTPTPDAEVSVVIGTLNRAEKLKKAVESVRRNGIAVPYEIIVVDGGSVDGTIDWLVRQDDIISIVQHNLRTVNQVRRRAKSWGYFMNLGFRTAQGRYVLMISDDCLLVPDSVTNAIERIKEAQSRGRRIGGAAFYFRDYPEEDRYYVQQTLGGMLMVNHGIFMKDALIAVGYAEEDLYAFYKCDSDLALKLWHAGYEIIDCPGSVVEHLLLPDERQRLENNATLDRDRDRLIDRWSGIYVLRYDLEIFKRPTRRYSDFVDPHATAAGFSEFLPAIGRPGPSSR